ncbi:CinA family protein [Roseibium sp.]|uniref:CinA family protein n=1 Tax=Roseibium sp. TaxID=1936156 RepID=UPI002603DEC4|nr:CinA family protein [Roseibium sp.]
MIDKAPQSFDDLAPLAALVLEELKSRGMMVATAESCTGGMICSSLTEISGSSAVVDRGFVTYSNEAKVDLLGVSPELIEKVGAVSKEVAIAMAEGALSRSNADVAVSVTGIAGPGGGSEEKPVGTVHIAIACKNQSIRHAPCLFSERDRKQVRLETVQTALSSILNALTEESAR